MSRMGREVGEQSELGPGHVDQLTGSPDLVCRLIQDHVGDGQLAAGGAGLAASTMNDHLSTTAMLL